MIVAESTPVAVQTQSPATTFNLAQAVVDHLPMAKRMARSAFFRWGQSFDEDDLFQYASLGLVNAARQFDITKCADFTGFANVHVRWALARGRDEMATIHRKAYKNILAGKWQKPVFVHDNEQHKIADAIVGAESDPFEVCASQDEIDTRLSWLRTHNPREAEIVALRLEGKTFPEAAKLMGI